MKRMSSMYRSTVRNVFALALSVAFVVAASGCSETCSSCGAKQKLAWFSPKCPADCDKACCAKKAETASAPVNAKCPFSGLAVDAAVTASSGGTTVAFCCDDCKVKWETLSDDEKSKKLASVK